MVKIKDWIVQKSTARMIAVAVALWLVSIVALTFSDERIAEYAPDTTKPDLHIGFSHADIISMFTALGEEGRQAYGINLLIDTVMPVLFGVMTVLLMAKVLPRRLMLLSVAPITFVMLDIIENAAFGVMLLQYPDIALWLVAATSLVTLVKLTAYMFAAPLFVLRLVSLGIRRLNSPVWRTFVWVLGLALVVVWVTVVGIQPAIYAYIGKAVATVWGVGFILLVELDRRRTERLELQPILQVQE
jgi:hypothetical protein